MFVSSGESMRLFNCLIFALNLTSCLLLNSSSAQLKELVAAKDPSLNIGYCFIPSIHSEFTYNRHAKRLFTPASNTKLFTAAAAFYFLGADYVCKTSLASSGLIKGSLIHGNVFVQFSGDPSLTKHDIEELFLALKNRDITRIDGDICLTSEIEENEQTYYAPGFSFDDIGAWYNPPVSAYIIDGNTCLDANNKKIIVLKPLEQARETIISILQQLDITLRGNVRHCTDSNNPCCTIECHESKPLNELISHMLKTSDNLYANALFKCIGKNVSKTEGSWKTGREAVKKFASDCLGIAPNMWVLDDGAGLSRYNLISPEQIIKLLTWIYQQKHLFPLFVECLAISGTDGTLQNRMTDHQGIIKAKTGTLSGASALSGYLCLPDSEPYIFSIILNGFIQNKPEADKVPVNYKLDIEDCLCRAVIDKIQKLPVAQS